MPLENFIEYSVSGKITAQSSDEGSDQENYS